LRHSFEIVNVTVMLVKLVMLQYLAQPRLDSGAL